MLVARVLSRLFLAVVLAVAPGAALAAVGHVIAITGDPSLLRAGQPLQALVPFSALEAGDALFTGPDDSVQFRMENGEEYTLHPQTEFVIDEFRMPKAASAPGTGRSFYRLLAGGFRAVTRSVASRGFDSYRVVTPVATMGIRGTIFNASLDDGLYLRVEQGAVMLQNGVGVLEVKAGQLGYVANAITAPRYAYFGPSSLSSGAGAGATGTTSASGTGAAGALSAGSALLGLGIVGAVAALTGDSDSTTATTATTGTAP